MPEWLTSSIAVTPPVSAMTMAVRITIALALGGVIAAAYRMTHGWKARDAWTMATTIVLLTGLLAMISMVIGESVARAFGLVGALSIVRFRTVVEDTRDTAFVIFAVIVGMAVGTGLVIVAAVGLPLVIGAAFAMNTLSGRGGSAASGGRELVLTVRVGIGRELADVNAAIDQRASRRGLIGVRTVRQGSAVDVRQRVSVRDEEAAGLVLALNSIDGVQEVELSSVESGGT